MHATAILTPQLQPQPGQVDRRHAERLDPARVAVGIREQRRVEDDLVGGLGADTFQIRSGQQFTFYDLNAAQGDVEIVN